MPFIEQLQEKFNVNLESFKTDHLSLEQYGALKEFVVAELQPNLHYPPLKSFLIFFLPKSTDSDRTDIDTKQETALLELLCQTAAFFDTNKIEREENKLRTLICSGRINNNPIILLEVINVIQFVFQGIIRSINLKLEEAKAKGTPISIQAELTIFDQYKICSKQLIAHNPPVTLDQCIISIYNRIMLLSHELSILDHCENTPEQYLSLVADADKVINLFSQIIQHNNDRVQSCFAPIGSSYILTDFKNISDLQEVILHLFDRIAAAKDKFITADLDDTKKANIDAAFAAIKTLTENIEAIDAGVSEPSQPPHTQLYTPATVADIPAIPVATTAVEELPKPQL